MIKYRPALLRPAVTSPTIWRRAPYVLGQTFDSLFEWGPVAGDTIRLLFHGATAALGYHVWLKDRGFFKYFGLVLALGQTVGALCDVISLGQRYFGTHPPETEEQA